MVLFMTLQTEVLYITAYIRVCQRTRSGSVDKYRIRVLIYLPLFSSSHIFYKLYSLVTVNLFVWYCFVGFYEPVQCFEHVSNDLRFHNLTNQAYVFQTSSNYVEGPISEKYCTSKRTKQDDYISFNRDFVRQMEYSQFVSRDFVLVSNTCEEAASCIWHGVKQSAHQLVRLV